MANELWKNIKGFEGKYQVSTFGRIRSLVNNRGHARELIRKPRKGKNGYLYLSLWQNGTPYCKKIHRLVVETFLENKDNLPAVNHKDGNKLNNAIHNLEWCSYSDNTKHAITTSLFKPKLFESGSKNPMFGKRLGNSQFAKRVIQASLDGYTVRIWNCIKEAEKELHIAHITDVCKGKRNTAGGYMWKYVEE